MPSLVSHDMITSNCNMGRPLSLAFVERTGLARIYANDLCSASITLVQRSAWQSNGNSNQLWDIVVTNSGSCPIFNVFGTIDVHDGGQIAHSWNYDNSTHEITGFASSLYVGSVCKTAGFVHTGSAVPTISHINPKCPVMCSFPSPISHHHQDTFNTRAWPISIR